MGNLYFVYENTILVVKNLGNASYILTTMIGNQAEGIALTNGTNCIQELFNLPTQNRMTLVSIFMDIWRTMS